MSATTETTDTETWPYADATEDEFDDFLADGELVELGEVPDAVPPPDSVLDEPADRLGKPMPADRLRGWLVTLAVTLIGAVIRFQNLGNPTDNGTPIFDEKHYVPQALQMLRNGGFEDNPGYELTVHPPVGKYLIAIGEWLFGYNAVGWRFASALAGAIMVFLIVRAARRLTRSTRLGAIAGILLICDGVTHVMARMGMLDIFFAMFILLAFTFLLMDRDQARERLRRAMRAGIIGDSPYGPRLGFRWYRFATAVTLGVAGATKWDGSFWIPAFAALTLFWDVSARKAAGVRKPWAGTIVRDLLPAVWAFVVVPILAYLACWWAWFSSETGIERHVAGGYSYHGSGIGPDSMFWFIPNAIRSLWYYSGNVLYFHEHLLTPKDNPHPWESKPWTWPMGLRPMLYYYETGPAAGCGTNTDCLGATMLVGTPAMWWVSLPVLGFAFWRSVARFDWRYIAVLVTYLAGYLPWFLNLDRQMYFFYATPLASFLILGIVLVLGEIMGPVTAGFERRRTGLLVVALYVGLVVANFAWLWPILNGDPISAARWQAELWLPSWR